MPSTCFEHEGSSSGRQWYYSRLPEDEPSGSKHVHRGAEKSLALPGRKQATATEGFDVHISYL
jgi:hypothetical protein